VAWSHAASENLNAYCGAIAYTLVGGNTSDVLFNATTRTITLASVSFSDTLTETEFEIEGFPSKYPANKNTVNGGAKAAFKVTIASCKLIKPDVIPDKIAHVGETITWSVT